MTVILEKPAARYLEKVSEPYFSRITEALAGLEEEPPQGDIEPLQGRPGGCRLRIGRYRALFRVTENAIFVTHIKPRGQAYKKK